MRNRPIGIAFLVAFWSTSLVAQTSVRTWVSSGGVDNASCSRTSPCRTFTAAINAVADGGEVVALDSAGYGPFLVTKAVTVLAPAGVHAALAPTAGTAITINAPDLKVNLRGLYLNAQGANDGVEVLAAAALQVENLVINGFDDNGIRVFLASGTHELLVLDTIVRNNEFGIFLNSDSSVPVRATIDRSRVDRNRYGIRIGFANVTLTNSVLAGNEDTALDAFGNGAALPARVGVENSVASGNGAGFLITNGFMSIHASAAINNRSDSLLGPGFHANGEQAVLDLENCMASNNGTLAVRAFGGSTVVISGCLLRGGVENTLSTIYTRQNNTIPGTVIGVLTPLPAQ